MGRGCAQNERFLPIFYSAMKNVFWIVLMVSAASLVVLAMSVRGIPGNPTENTINDPKWKADGPFELSPDRGRFALLYSVVEEKSLSFSLPIAQFATPDLGLYGDKYVSLFAPALSFILIPGYLLGKALGAGQVGAFAIVALFAVGNIWMIYLISRFLGAHKPFAALAAVGFLLSTPALAYAVTMYQHHVTTFLLLLGFYIFLRWNTVWSLMLLWCILALSVSLDYPNFFIFFPLGLYTLARMIGISIHDDEIQVRLRPWLFVSIVGLVLPLMFFFTYNNYAYGNPWQLAGTLPQVKTITGIIDANDLQSKRALQIDDASENNDKSAIGFFETRNLLHGFYIHFISPDRGIIWYAPIVMLGIFGMPFLYRRHSSVLAFILFTCGALILLYSMWGDPWGGWAFGSRYLIPVYALMSISLAVGLTHSPFKKVILIAFLILFCYGAGVNVLGALTTNANPPQAEVLALEKLSGTQQKYTYARNWDYLHTKGSKSFFYAIAGRNVMSPVQYYFLVVCIAIVPVIIAISYILIRPYVRH